MERVPSRKSHLDKLRRRLLVGGAVLVLIVAGVFYLTGGRYVSTDDAYVQAARVEVSSDVDGRVTAVEVKDNQLVHKGEPLFRLDGRPFRIAVQCHPERRESTPPAFERLFAFFVDACRGPAASR